MARNLNAERYQENLQGEIDSASLNFIRAATD
jgi:hypothetical protein